MKTREVIFNSRVVGVAECVCPSCGSKSLPRVVHVGKERRQHACKCTQCGMNTGSRKSPRLALAAWNAMADRMISTCRYLEGV